MSVSEPGSTVLPGRVGLELEAAPAAPDLRGRLDGVVVSVPASARVRTQARMSASFAPSATWTSTEVGDVALPEPSAVQAAVPSRCDSALPSPPDAKTARSPVAWRLIEPEWATSRRGPRPSTVATARSSASATTL